MSPISEISSRIFRYPEGRALFQREVHAPCRPPKFNLSSTSRSRVPPNGSERSSVLFNQLQQARNAALASIRLLQVDMDTDSSVQHEQQDALRHHSTNMDVVVVSAGNMLRNLSLGPDSHLSAPHADNKLLHALDNPQHTLKSLNFEIQLKQLSLEPFVPLTIEQQLEVERAFSANRKKVLVTHAKSNIEISADKFQCLRPGAWLNDEVINLYLELLKERERRERQKFLNCHFFNTFFYKKLISGKDGYNFKSVRRWTSQKKLGYGLHECDKIFVPIHKEIHWCLAVINTKDKKFQYLDSLKGKDAQVLKVLARYFIDEVKDKTGKEIDVTSWEQEFVEDLPEQENRNDCGVFMIKYADFCSRNLGLCFNQEHMPYFRLRTAKEILRLKAD